MTLPKIILVPKQTDTCAVLFCVHSGSNNEKKEQNGISHFLEHLVFEKTQKFEDARKLSLVIDNVGGEMNAATSKTDIQFYAKVPGEHIEKALDVVSQMALYPVFEQEIFEKEKKVVLQEIDMRFDNPNAYAYELFDAICFDTHPAKQPIAGTKKSVGAITIEQVKKYYEQHFVAKNCTLVIAGNYPDTIHELITQYFEFTNEGEKSRYNTTIEENTKKNHSETRPNLQQTYYKYGCKVQNKGTKQSYVLDVIESLLAKGQSGWLMEEFRIKRGIGYSVTAYNEAMQSGSTFFISLIIDPTKLELSKDLITQILAKLQTVSETDVENAKQYVIGTYKMEQDDLINACTNAIEQDGLADYKESIQNVTKEDVIRVAKELGPFTQVIVHS